MGLFALNDVLQVAYVGGLDITKGRWDTPEHHIFKTLNSEHAADFR